MNEYKVRYKVKKGLRHGERGLLRAEVEALQAEGWTVTPVTEMPGQGLPVKDMAQRYARGASRGVATLKPNMGRKSGGGRKTGKSSFETHVVVRTLHKNGTHTDYRMPREMVEVK